MSVRSVRINYNQSHFKSQAYYTIYCFYFSFLFYILAYIVFAICLQNILQFN